ncbi:MAG TPA: hypothetical protein VFG87_13020, partial [Amycolatopsis sp.]|nr:hypothetical protein [Amycolatopsis sp.]
MRDAVTGGRAARLGLRLLFATGVALAAWFFAALLGAFTASADEGTPQPGSHPATPDTGQPQLLASVTG